MILHCQIETPNAKRQTPNNERQTPTTEQKTTKKLAVGSWQSTLNKERETKNPSEIARPSHFTVYPVEYEERIIQWGVNNKHQTTNTKQQTK